MDNESDDTENDKLICVEWDGRWKWQGCPEGDEKNQEIKSK